MRALEKLLEVRLKETLDFSLQFRWETGVWNLPVVLTSAHTETNRISVTCHAFIFQRAFHIAIQGKSKQSPFANLNTLTMPLVFKFWKYLLARLSHSLNRSYMCILSHVSHTEMTSTVSLLYRVPFLGTEDIRHAAQVISEPQLPPQGKAQVHLTSTMETTRYTTSVRQWFIF